MMKKRRRKNQNECSLFKGVIVAIILLVIGRTLYMETRFYFCLPLFQSMRGRLNCYDVVLVEHETFHLSVFEINKRISFSSENMKIATVDLTGGIRAWRPGKTFVKVKYDKKEIKCRVRVIGLNHYKCSMNIGKTKRIRVKNAGFTWIRYQSSNPHVVSVNRFGKITAKKKGTAIITVSCRGKKMKCKVVVN